MIMSSAIRTMMSCGTKMSNCCGYPQFPGQLLPTGVKSNCRLYHLRRLLLFLFRRLSSCLRSGAMPPSVGILRSGSAGLKPSCCQLRRSWLVMQLVLHHWNKCLRDRYQYSQSAQSTLHRRHRMSLVTCDISPRSHNRSPGPPDRGRFPAVRVHILYSLAL